MKIVLNKCFGGFGMSARAIQEMKKRGYDRGWGHEYDEDRANPDLVEVVEKICEKANDEFSELKVVEIPDNAYWYITDYDGIETVVYSECEIHTA